VAVTRRTVYTAVAAVQQQQHSSGGVDNLWQPLAAATTLLMLWSVLSREKIAFFRRVF
jgi:hypothetical protein